jgi:membrane fusion protein (multidrug efflux system)
VQSQYQVLVVTPENKAKFRPVKMGQRVGTNWIVTDGLQPGERVVAEGILRVQQAAQANPESAQKGIPVTPKPYAALASEKTGSD